MRSESLMARITTAGRSAWNLRIVVSIVAKVRIEAIEQQHWWFVQDCSGQRQSRPLEDR